MMFLQPPQALWAMSLQRGQVTLLWSLPPGLDAMIFDAEWVAWREQLVESCFYREIERVRERLKGGKSGSKHVSDGCGKPTTKGQLGRNPESFGL
jgi:hypothetical protein